MAEPPGPADADACAGEVEPIVLVRDPSVRWLQPARHGGAAVAPAEFVSAVADLAARDGSAGWLAAAVNTAAHAVAGLGEAAAERVWGADTGALVTACVPPAGRLTGRRGKLRLTGRWESVTGAEYADWLLLGALAGDGARRVLLPRAAVRVERRDGPRGLDGAGISDVTVADTVVDESAVFSHGDNTPWGTEEFDAAVQIVTGAGQAAAVVGAATGVWQAHVGQVRRRLATSYGSEDTTELTSSAVLVAAAASDIDAAALQIVGSLGATASDAATAHRQAVTRARDAADRLLASGSRHALDAADPVARRWLDVLAGHRLTIRGAGGGPGAR